MKTLRETIELASIGLRSVKEKIDAAADAMDLAHDVLEPDEAMPGCAKYARWAVTERYGRTDETIKTFADYGVAYEYLCHQAEEPAALEEVRLFATRGMEAGQAPRENGGSTDGEGAGQAAKECGGE